MIDQVIYDMLTESTGIHPMDSGNDQDRNWQRNQKRTLEDFQQEPHYKLTVRNWGDSDFVLEAQMSLFHYLTKSLRYDEKETNFFHAWYENEKEQLNKEGIYKNHYMLPEIYYEKVHGSTVRKNPEAENTEDFENHFSQAFQFLRCRPRTTSSERTMWTPEKVFLSIHGGADTIGGYTDFQVFIIDDVDVFDTVCVPHLKAIEGELKEDRKTLAERLSVYGVPDSIAVVDKRQAEEVEE